MSSINPWMLMLVAACGTTAVQAQIRPLFNPEPLCVFAGGTRDVPVRWLNDNGTNVTTEIRTQLYQTSSATAMKIANTPARKIQVLAGQTVLDSAPINVPAVRAETAFLMQWLEGTTVLGSKEVLAYPTNLLDELKEICGDNDALGILDPQKKIAASFRLAGLAFTDLEEMGTDRFHGRLAIIGPFPSKTLTPADLTGRVRRLAQKGVPVVWLQPPLEKHDNLQPSFYSVLENRSAIVVAQSDLVAALSENPRSQLNLIQLCKQALHPAPPRLPSVPSKP
jgi:hypothetical protein